MPNPPPKRQFYFAVVSPSLSFCYTTPNRGPGPAESPHCNSNRTSQLDTLGLARNPLKRFGTSSPQMALASLLVSAPKNRSVVDPSVFKTHTHTTRARAHTHTHATTHTQLHHTQLHHRWRQTRGVLSQTPKNESQKDIHFFGCTNANHSSFFQRTFGPMMTKPNPKQTFCYEFRLVQLFPVTTPSLPTHSTSSQNFPLDKQANLFSGKFSSTTKGNVDGENWQSLRWILEPTRFFRILRC